MNTNIRLTTSTATPTRREAVQEQTMPSCSSLPRKFIGLSPSIISLHISLTLCLSLPSYRALSPLLPFLSLSLPFLSLPPPIWLPANPDFDLDIDSGYRTNDKSSWQRRGRQSADFHHTSGGWQRARPRLSNSQPVRRRGGDNCPHRVSRPQSSHRRMYLHLLLVIIVYSVWSRRFPSVISSLL